MNGLEISSSPSTGQINVIVGPRSTVRPSRRVRGSGATNASRIPSQKKKKGERRRRDRARTLYVFLHLVKDEIEQLVIPLEHARH